MKSCITCGMPLEGAHTQDLGFESPDGPVCKFDSEDGKIKSPSEIFQGGIAFFAHSVTGGDQDLAIRLTRKNMRALSYWQERPFAELDGPEASHQEFASAMEKLAHQ